MKHLYKIILFLCLVGVTFSTTSCLKSDPMFDYSQVTPLLEMPYKSHSVLQTKVTNKANVKFNLMVNYTISYASDNKTDINVTLGVDEAQLAAYNASLSSSTKKYVLLPAGTYTLPSAVIKNGTQLWKEDLEVNTSGLKAGEKYLLPVKIVGAPEGYTVSGNFGYVNLRIDMEK